MNTHLLGMEERSKELNKILLEQGDEFSLVYTRTWKNNMELEGYVLRSKNNDCAPTVYYNSNWYDQDDLSVVSFLYDMYKKNAHEFDITNLMNKDYVLSKIRPRLVSDKNRLLLDEKHIAYVPYLDMMVLFYIPIESDGDTTASVQVSDGLLKSVGVAIDDAYTAALENLMRDIEIKPLIEVLCSDMGLDPSDIGYGPVPMWVVTVKNKIQGAAAMLCKSSLKLLEEKLGDKVAILPSSVHECIAVPYESEAQFAFYKAMVEEVNGTQVEPIDRLTDSVYLIEDGEIRIAA